MSFNSAMWRSVSSNLTEGSVSGVNLIQFNEEPIITNNMIVQTEFNVKVDIAENERPKQGLNELQDNGIGSVDVIVTGRFVNPSSNTAIQNMLTWLVETKTTTQAPFGRFGLRLDDFPQFNVTPTSTYGYILSDVKFVRDGTYKGRAAFIATFRLNGDESVLAS